MVQYKVSNSHNQGQTASQISTYNFPVDINNSQYLPTDLCTSVHCHKTDEVLALKIKLLLQYRPAKISASRDENIIFNRRARLIQRTVLWEHQMLTVVVFCFVYEYAVLFLCALAFLSFT